jgi:hypothetical protein
MEPISTKNGMHYHGLVLSLDNFPGDVIVQECTFENNLFRYTSCIDVDPREDSTTSLLKPAVYSNNFNLLNRSPG